MNDKIFLATTALKEFWDSSSQILFLGEWCLRYDQRARWESLPFEVAPYPWDDQTQMKKAYAYCDESYEAILKQLSEHLNAVHQVNYSTRYWRLVLGEWLWRYVQIVYDRYACLSQALAQNENLTTIVLDKQSYEYVTTNCTFLQKCYTDTYNLQLFSQILKYLGYTFPEKQYRESEPLAKRIKQLVSQSKGRLESKLAPRRSTSIGSAKIVICEPFISSMEVSLLSKEFPGEYRNKYFQQTSDQITVNQQKRREFASLKQEDEFQQLCLQMMEYCLPLDYLERYQATRENVLKEKAPVPKGIISSVGWRFNMLMAIYIAEMTERGSKLFGVQHGGGYGLYEKEPMFDNEIKSVDTFLSWGWTEERKNVIALPQAIQPTRQFQASDKKGKTFLYVANMHARYQHIFQSSPLGPQHKRYIEDQIKFFKKLPEDIRQKFIVRLYAWDFGWCNKARLKRQFPDLRFQSQRQSLLEAFKDAELIVIDNSQTTFLQALAMNKPTVVFWDQEMWEIRSTAKDIFAQLQQESVFHDSPESATEFISAHKDHIRDWWYSASVQKVVNDFCHRYARTSPDWVSEWNRAIVNNLKETKQYEEVSAPVSR